MTFTTIDLKIFGFNKVPISSFSPLLVFYTPSNSVELAVLLFFPIRPGANGANESENDSKGAMRRVNPLFSAGKTQEASH